MFTKALVIAALTAFTFLPEAETFKALAENLRFFLKMTNVQVILLMIALSAALQMIVPVGARTQPTTFAAPPQIKNRHRYSRRPLLLQCT